ncbi:MAG: MFS transporter [Proteobacteria bacterium]|nr:MFS transporter [Pseudomonadota bacterium]MBI3497124.1 MFS transporter [Pseudomonadota bacterium]
MHRAADQSPDEAAPARAHATLITCGATHALHDGLGDALYLLLPIWQSSFGLSLAEIGLLKTSFSAALASVQVPAGIASERLGEPALLALGTAAMSLGFLLLGLADGFAPLALAIGLMGAGAAVQHPLSSALVAAAYGEARRRLALGTYNFAGDLGKVAIPAALGLASVYVGWRSATMGLGAFGILGSAFLYAMLVRLRPGSRHDDRHAAPARGGWGIRDARGFAALSAIGVIDSMTRTGFLTLLPFFLVSRGAAIAEIGFALALVFAGGAAGKFLCGAIAGRLGIVATVILSEFLTSAAVLALLVVPDWAAMLLLPLVGVGLNGTSSVLYGTIADLVEPERRARAFGLFYSIGIGAGALSPTVCGVIADRAGVPQTLALVALMVLLTLPLSAFLRQTGRIQPSLPAAP